MRYAANLSLLWPELPYLDRFEAAAAAGFTGVEVLFPYDIAVKETQRALLAHGLEMVLINAPPPNYTGGDPGYAAQPEMIARFRRDIQRTFRYAAALGVSFVHVMAGVADGPDARTVMIENLGWASDEAPEGVTLTIEPLNPVAQPGYFLNDYALAADILRTVDRSNVGLQYDSYHAQMIHGDAVAVFETYAALICHVQVGDAPDRTAPGTGCVDFSALIAKTRDLGYEGWISGEYHPGGPTETTLSWREQ